MKKLMLFILTAITAALLAACDGTVTNTANSDGKPATSAPAPASKEVLLAIEKGAAEAFKNKDGKHFQNLLDENFVMLTPGKRMGKAETVKHITDNPCTVGTFAFSDPIMTSAGRDVAVLTARVRQDVTCDGKKLPAENVVASVYIRQGDNWKAAFHNEVPVAAEPNTAAATQPAAPEAKSAEEKEKAAANEKGFDAPTAPLVALQKAGWDAWMARDANKLSEWTGSEVVFVDPTGKVFANKADVLKAWTEPKCEIKSVAVGEATGVPLTADASMLLSKGTAVGTCDGQKMPPLWGMSMYLKQGDAWKLVYLMEWAA